MFGVSRNEQKYFITLSFSPTFSIITVNLCFYWCLWVSKLFCLFPPFYGGEFHQLKPQTETVIARFWSKGTSAWIWGRSQKLANLNHSKGWSNWAAGRKEVGFYILMISFNFMFSSVNLFTFAVLFMSFSTDRFIVALSNANI